MTKITGPLNIETTSDTPQLTIKINETQNANIINILNDTEILFAVDSTGNVVCGNVSQGGNYNIVGTSNSAELQITASDGQTESIILVKNNDNVSLLDLDAYGKLNVPKLKIAGNSDDVQLTLQPHDSYQNANIVEIKDAGGNRTIAINKDGLLSYMNIPISNFAGKYNYVNNLTDDNTTYTIADGGENVVITNPAIQTLNLPCIETVRDGRSFTVVICGYFTSGPTITTVQLKSADYNNGNIWFFPNFPTFGGVIGNGWGIDNCSLIVSGGGVKTFTVQGHVKLTFTAIGESVIEDFSNQYIGKNWYVSY